MQLKISQYLSFITYNAKCYSLQKKMTLHIILDGSFPSRNMVTVASCCENVFFLFEAKLKENLLEVTKDMRLGQKCTFPKDTNPKHTVEHREVVVCIMTKFNYSKCGDLNVSYILKRILSHFVELNACTYSPFPPGGNSMDV